MAGDTETWIVAWRIHRREKQQLFDSKSDATQLVRDLLASDTELLILSRVPVRVTFQITAVESSDGGT